MAHDPAQILSVLDKCCEDFSFPILGNGYVYLAASRLSGYYSERDWAIVIEIFGFSPRSGLPDIHVYTFASRLHDRDRPDQYVSEEAYHRYLSNHSNNESRFFHPVNSDWQDPNSVEFVSESANIILVRDDQVVVPSPSDYSAYGINLMDFPRVRVFELCRFLAAARRESVLATTTERRISVLPELKQILQLEEWHHPDVCGNELPSSTDTFRLLAKAVANGEPDLFQPTEAPNTHWSNWPDSGTL